MSNKTQLQTNNTKYASLIDTLRGKSLPTGGGSSGGSIETCTLVFRGVAPTNIVYTTSDETGVYTQIALSTSVHNGLIVACNSYIGVIGNTANALNGDLLLNRAELIVQQNYGAIFKITAMSGETAIITVNPNTEE